MPTTPARRSDGSSQAPYAPRRPRRSRTQSSQSISTPTRTWTPTPARDEVRSGRVNRSAARSRGSRGSGRSGAPSPALPTSGSDPFFVSPPGAMPPPHTPQTPRPGTEVLNAEELFAHLFRSTSDGIRTPRAGDNGWVSVPQSPVRLSLSGVSTPRLATPGTQTPRGGMAFVVTSGQTATFPFQFVGDDINQFFAMIRGVFGVENAHIVLAEPTLPNPRGVDTENVMWRDRMDRTVDSIRALQKSTKFAPRGSAAITKLVKDLEGFRQYGAKVPPVLAKTRLSLPEYENALRTLSGCSFADRTPALTDNPAFTLAVADELTGTPAETIGIADLLGLIMGAINDYEHPDGLEATAKNRTIMSEGLMLALAHCYDTDLEADVEVPTSEAFRVCEVGIVQRLMSVLQAYVPGVRIDSDTQGEPMTNPGELLSQFAQAFYRDLKGQDPSQAQLDTFCAEAKTRARDFWEDGSRELHSFDAQLEFYLSNDYGWEKPDEESPREAPPDFAMA